MRILGVKLYKDAFIKMSRILVCCILPAQLKTNPKIVELVLSSNCLISLQGVELLQVI